MDWEVRRSIDEELELLLRALTPRQFEVAMGYILHENGWNVRLTPYSDKDGYDLELVAGKRRRLVEVKSGDQKVGAPVVQKTSALFLQESVSEIACVSISGYTKDAVQAAEKIRQESIVECLDLRCLDEVLETAVGIPNVTQTLENIRKGRVAPSDIIRNGQLTIDAYDPNSKEAHREELRCQKAARLSDTKAMFIG